MLSPPNQDPLRRHEFIHTRDPDEMRYAALTRMGVSRFTVPSGGEAFEGQFSFIVTDRISLGLCGCRGGAAAEFIEADFARLQVAVAGVGATTSAGATVAINAQQGCVTAPDRNSIVDFAPGYEQLALRIGHDTLRSKLKAMLGFAPKGPIAFEAALRTDTAEVQGLLQLMRFCRDQLDPANTTLPEPVMRKLEQAVVVSFLCATRHNFTHLLQRESGAAAPVSVRLAEQFIEANWRRTIEIEELTALTGVSARTLARAFVAHRGYSPRMFAKQVRLRQARTQLEAGAATLSVTAVALACNFANLGHFAKDYGEAFGELPSATLARALRLRA